MAQQRGQRGRRNTRPARSGGVTQAQRTPRASATALSQPDEDPRVVERIPVAPDDRLLLTAEEAARRLSISRALCYRLIGSGELPSLVIGAKLRRIPVQALDAYIKAQLQAAAL